MGRGFCFALCLFALRWLGHDGFQCPVLKPRGTVALAAASPVVERGVSFDWTGQRALVTGAASGIGYEVAKQLIAGGAHVVGLDVNAEGLQTAAKALNAEFGEGRVSTIAADLSDADATVAAAEAAGDIDLLVNSAGLGRMQGFMDVDVESFDLMMAVNCRAVLQISQVIARNMIGRGARGAIVHVSSQSSQQAIRDRCAYSLTKAGVDYLTKNMALELGPHGIRTNCVNPTVVLTTLGKEAWKNPDKAAPMKESIPLGRFAEPEEIADTILYLLSDRASMVNGLAIPIDGGFLASRAHLP